MADTGAAGNIPPEIMLLRQDNLPFVASVVNAAFTGENMSEIPRKELLGIIRSCAERFAAASDEPGKFSGTPEYYLGYWTGIYGDIVWFGTRQSADGVTHVHLLAPAARAIEFYNGCESASTLAARGDSAMHHLLDTMVQGAARLSGNVEARRANLEGQIQRLQAQFETIDEATPPTEEERRDIYDQIARAYSDTRTAINALADKMRETNRKELDRISTGSVGKAILEYRQRLARHHESPAYRALTAMREILVDPARRIEVADADHVLRIDLRTNDDAARMRLPSRIFDGLMAATSQIHEHELRAIEIQNSLIDSSSLDTHRHLMTLVNEALDGFKKLRNTHEPSRRDRRLAGKAITVPALPKLDRTSLVRLTTEIPERRVLIAPIARVLPGADDDRDASLQAAVDRSLHMKAREDQILSPDSAGKRLSELLVEKPVRYGIEEVVRCIDICGRKVPSRYEISHMMLVEIELSGIRRTMTAPDPIILAEGAPSQGQAEMQDYLEDHPSYPFSTDETEVAVELRKIDLNRRLDV